MSILRPSGGGRPSPSPCRIRTRRRPGRRSCSMMRKGFLAPSKGRPTDARVAAPDVRFQKRTNAEEGLEHDLHGVLGRVAVRRVSLARRRLPGSRKSTRGSETPRSPSRPWTPFSNLFSMTPRFRRPMTSKSVRFEDDEPPMTPASWRSLGRTGQSLSGFESPQRPLTGTSTPRPRTSGSVRFADEVEVEDLEDPLEMMSQTAPPASIRNENSSIPRTRSRRRWRGWSCTSGRMWMNG